MLVFFSVLYKLESIKEFSEILFVWEASWEYWEGSCNLSVSKKLFSPFSCFCFKTKHICIRLIFANHNISSFVNTREVLQTEFWYEFRKGPSKFAAGTVFTVFKAIMQINTVNVVSTGRNMTRTFPKIVPKFGLQTSLATFVNFYLPSINIGIDFSEG